MAVSTDYHSSSIAVDKKKAIIGTWLLMYVWYGLNLVHKIQAFEHLWIFF